MSKIFPVNPIAITSDGVSIFRECELWCGISGAQINIFSLRDSVVSERKTLVHSKPTELMADFTVSILYSADDFVYSYVSPGCILYQWSNTTKLIENRLDCSKLVPCSESLNSISIDEHLSPVKCQVLDILNTFSTLCNNLFLDN